MTQISTLAALLDAVGCYFALMYDNDLARFDEVFAPGAQLHGLRDGNLRRLPVADYRQQLAAAASPKSKNAPRHEEILLVELAAPTQALVKVRVRIDALQYIDYLAYHLIDGAWRITAKSFHIEARFETAAA
ncbi:MAG: nuclear transport factor 2 family protein [Alphaproteobacteria bacterium]|nr:nuclear transport factor 2 family protein [Alphaproteobacteria bacterium]